MPTGAVQVHSLEPLWHDQQVPCMRVGCQSLPTQINVVCAVVITYIKRDFLSI